MITLFDKKGLPMPITCASAHDAVRLLKVNKKAETAKDETGAVIARRYHKAHAEALRPLLDAGVKPGQLSFLDLVDDGLDAAPSPLPRLVRACRKAHR